MTKNVLMNNLLCNNLFFRRTPLGERLRQNTKVIEQNKADRKKRKKSYGHG